MSPASVHGDFAHGWRWGELLGLAALALALVVLGQLPFAQIAVYPFRLFGTFVHELSHGLTAVMTGGRFERFVVRPDLSGLAWSAGGVRWLVSSAGYVGSAVFGGVLILAAARGVRARHLLLALGLALGVLCLVFVRNLFGIVTGLALAAALILAARRLRGAWADGLLLILALELVLDGYNSLLVLFHLSALSAVQTDALSMQAATGVPALVWAVLWALVSTLLLGATLWLAYRGRSGGKAG
jgi:hypothetical protein